MRMPFTSVVASFGSARASGLVLALALPLVAMQLPACDSGSDLAQDESDVSSQMPEGTPEALSILALVNDRAVTSQTLRNEAGVSKRAAENIIAHREGKDATQRTADDDLYDTIAELDAVSQVGPATLEALADYADQAGYLDRELAKQTDVVFSPQPADQSHTARVAQLIGGAQSSIDILMYSFSDAAISKALEAAVDRGVRVRFIFDTATDDQKLTGSALTSSKSGQLEQRGVNVRYVNKIMHHKVMIVDGPRDDIAASNTAYVVTGSANWSSGAATKYDENTLFLKGQAELALRFQGEFNHLWEHSRDVVVDASLPYELSLLPVTENVIPDGPGFAAFFTSGNFNVTGTTFSAKGTSVVADELVRAIKEAKKSIHVASGHLRSRPVAEALMAKRASDPNVEIRVYLDGQEYISKTGHTTQVKDLEKCIAAAGSSASKLRACTDKGFLFGYQVGESKIDVRYKYYAYRWDAGYAKQMHNKYMIIDGTTLYTGSYNLSDNAEHETFENMLVFRGPEWKKLAGQYEESFAKIWETGRAAGLYDQLVQTVKTADVIPLVFEPMALDWQQVTSLKALIRENCPAADSEGFRTDPTAHQICQRP